MRNQINRLAIKLFERLGYTISKSDPVMEHDVRFIKIYSACSKYTMTSKSAMFALYKGVEYIVKSGIKGDLVECGVWKGGSAMLIALTLVELKESTRNIYLYDTFEGMSEPSEADFLLSDASIDAKKLMQEQEIVKAFSPLDEVKRNMASTNYPGDKLNFIQGKVEGTIPNTMPVNIALLRLDTDWYESTKHELNYLYPLLSTNGVLICDDYGFWAGHKKAVDEYFENEPMLLIGLSGGARIGIKTNPV